MRKTVLIIIGALLITASFLLGSYLIEKNKKAKPQIKKSLQSVSVKTVKTKEIPIQLNASGNLVAKRRIEIYAEVAGVLKTGKKPFKEGTIYKKGETLIRLNSDEFYAQLQSQKSQLYNLITAIQPDLRLDFPKEFKKWNDYLKSFNLNKTVPKLPEFNTDTEKFFISGRGIITAYYNVKNLELKYNKYNIKAPFDGIVTEAIATEGSLVRVGQKIGEYINTGEYELQVTVEAEYANLLKIGNTVTLTNLEKTKSYKGKIVRVNGSVEQTSQTIKVYININDDTLKEGLFLEANVTAKTIKNAISIDRRLLFNDAVYTIQNDTILSLQKVKPIYFGAENVIITGLKDGTKILAKPISGAYNNMIVKTDKQQ
jgi:multidrug efflux pump subunit AcrA (membrane-fusion protein)